jgi:hypothetical protein
MLRISHIRRTLAVLAGALLATAGAAPAAFAMRLPPPGGFAGGSAQPVQVVTAGGMPGWQIALIALGAALFAAAAAVLLDRARAARRATAMAAGPGRG